MYTYIHICIDMYMYIYKYIPTLTHTYLYIYILKRCDNGCQCRKLLLHCLCMLLLYIST